MWSRNAAADTGVEAPGWGFAGSPLVVGDVVIVAASGRLAAYDVATGQPRWLGPTGGGGYSSPHLVTIDGVAQVLLLRGSRSTSVAPADGALLWEHRWQPGVSIVQPALTADGDVLVAAGDAMGGIGIRRLAVAHGPAGWTVEERWTSNGLKPYFNDFVVHKGHAFGFDGSILACIDLEDGQRKWKGGRYGHGQLVLLPDQDLLLVLSEEGELALVKATPDQFTELARVPGDRGQDLEPPGAGRRRPAGPQRRGDGRVPAAPRGPLTAGRVPGACRRRRDPGPTALRPHGGGAPPRASSCSWDFDCSGHAAIDHLHRQGFGEAGLVEPRAKADRATASLPPALPPPSPHVRPERVVGALVDLGAGSWPSVVVVLSSGPDLALHATGCLSGLGRADVRCASSGWPPAYRLVYGVLGSYVTARLAPTGP